MLWHVRCIICPLKMQQRLIGDWWLKPRTILRALRIFLFVSFYGCLWDKSVDLSIEVNDSLFCKNAFNIDMTSLLWWHEFDLKKTHNDKSILLAFNWSQRSSFWHFFCLHSNKDNLYVAKVHSFFKQCLHDLHLIQNKVHMYFHKTFQDNPSWHQLKYLVLYETNTLF